MKKVGRSNLIDEFSFRFTKQSEQDTTYTTTRSIRTRCKEVGFEVGAITKDPSVRSHPSGFKPARPTRAPVNAEPAMKLGMAQLGQLPEWNGTFCSEGERPITIFVKPESRYSCVNLSLDKTVATIRQWRGTIPAAIIAAITTEPPETADSASVPVARHKRLC